MADGLRARAATAADAPACAATYAPYVNGTVVTFEFGSQVARQNSPAETDQDLHPLREVPRRSWAGDG